MTDHTTETTPDVGKLQAAIDRADRHTAEAIAAAASIYAAPPEPDPEAVLAPRTPALPAHAIEAARPWRSERDRAAAAGRNSRRGAEHRRKVAHKRLAIERAIRWSGQWVEPDEGAGDRDGQR